MQKVEQRMQQLGFETYYKLPFIDFLSKKSKQPPFLIVLGFLVLCFILLLTPIGSFLATFLAFAIPAFKTFQALESEQKEDDVKLLTFWVVYGFLYSFDQSLSYVLSFIPFYYIIRTAFICYLFTSKDHGAEKIYNTIVQPLFSKYEKKIDEVVNPIEEKTRRLSQINKLKAD
jgi:receptor expression-enhancing protein 5/6